MAGKKQIPQPTHEVTHTSYSMMVAGNLQQVPVGTKLTLTAAQGDRMVSKGFVKPIGDAEAIDATSAEADAVLSENVELKAKVKAADARISELVTAAEGDKVKLEEAGVTITKLEEQITELKKKVAG